MEENGGVEECMKSGEKQAFTFCWGMLDCVSEMHLNRMFICVLSADSRSIDAVRKACKDVGSVSDIIFEMRFIPNVYSPGQEKIILQLTQYKQTA